MLKFNYFLRAIRGTEDYLEPLDTIISDQFLPALCDTTITDLDSFSNYQLKAAEWEYQYYRCHNNSRREYSS